MSSQHVSPIDRYDQLCVEICVFLSYRTQFIIWMIVDRNCCSLDDAVGLHMLETFSMDLGAVIIPTITSISTAKGKQSILLSLGNAPLRYGCRWEDVLLA